MFCAIVAGEAPAIRIHEDDDYLGILDIRPFTRGHALVIPKKHTVDLTDTPRKPSRRWRPSGSGSPGRPEDPVCTPTATISSSTTARPRSRPCSTSTCMWFPGATATSSFAKGMVLRRDPDREESGRLLRAALAQLDTAEQD